MTPIGVVPSGSRWRGSYAAHAPAGEAHLGERPGGEPASHRGEDRGGGGGVGVGAVRGRLEAEHAAAERVQRAEDDVETARHPGVVRGVDPGQTGERLEASHRGGGDRLDEALRLGQRHRRREPSLRRQLSRPGLGQVREPLAKEGGEGVAGPASVPAACTVILRQCKGGLPPSPRCCDIVSVTCITGDTRPPKANRCLRSGALCHGSPPLYTRRPVDLDSTPHRVTNRS